MRLAAALVGIAMALTAPGCSREAGSQGGVPGGTGVAGDTARLDEHRTLAASVVVGNLTVWPVVTDAPVSAVQVAAFEEAQKAGTVSVRELGGEAAVRAAQERLDGRDATAAELEEMQQTLAAAAAQVNRLTVENRGDVPVLICAGTVLRGGNQDRQVGEDVVVAANSTQEIEVFCVEQGRWNAMREGVDCGVEFASADVVATKEVRMSAQYLKSQQVVWANVAASNGGLGGAGSSNDDREPVVGGAGGGAGGQSRYVASQSSDREARTTFLLALEGASKEAAEARDRVVATVRSHFDSLPADGPAVVGFAYAVNGKPVGVRTFANPGLLRAVLPSFARSMALEAEAAKGEGESPSARAGDVVALVRAIEKGDAENPLVRSSHELRLRRTAAGYNGTCVLRNAVAPSGEEVTVTEDWTAR